MARAVGLRGTLALGTITEPVAAAAAAALETSPSLRAVGRPVTVAIRATIRATIASIDTGSPLTGRCPAAGPRRVVPGGLAVRGAGRLQTRQPLHRAHVAPARAVRVHGGLAALARRAVPAWRAEHWRPPGPPASRSPRHPRPSCGDARAASSRGHRRRRAWGSARTSPRPARHHCLCTGSARRPALSCAGNVDRAPGRGGDARSCHPCAAWFTEARHGGKSPARKGARGA